jgi:ATP-binding cassette, subfamily B, bacterial IrtB/YbtQ
MSGRTEYTTFKETYEAGKEIAGKYAGSYKLTLVYYIIAYVMQGLVYLSIYPLFRALFSSPVDKEGAWKWLGLMAAFALINGLARWNAHDFDYTDKIAEVMHTMRVKLGQKLRTMPLEILNSYKTGDLNSSLSSSVDESVMMMGMISGVFLEIVVTPTVVVLGTFFIDWRMALIMLAVIPLAVPLYHLKRKSAIDDKTNLALASSELESDIIEYIQGLPVLRITNQVGHNASQLQTGIVDVRDIQRASLWGSNILLMALDMLIIAALIFISVMGSIWVGEGTISIAAVAALLIIVSRLMEPLSLFLAITTALDIMVAGFRRVKSIMGIEPLEVMEPRKMSESFDVQFNNVIFSYLGQEEQVLQSVSFSIPKESMTAIVGSSGSGKTTITKLMMRYGDPIDGSITIGGVDIRRMSQEELLSIFAVVFQDVYLFDESIIENIRMAKPDASDDEVMEAAKSAYCHEFIERLPDGYDTMVGDIGGSLSGGERQRISIARAILKNSPIVILDEPTAALDTESEVAVQKAINTLVEDKTVIVIAHRLSTIAGADQILVIDNGKLVEEGTHNDLLVLQGKYYAMWSAQQRTKKWHMGI